MGWSRGSEIMEKIIPIIENVYIGAIGETEAFKQLIALFERHDCDTLDDCDGLSTAFDEALREAHPEWDEEE